MPGPRCLLLLVPCLLAAPATARAWNNEAHQEFSRRALEKSIVGPYLISELGLSRGLLEQVSRPNVFGFTRTRDVSAWVTGGSIEEDFPDLRVVAHFHNPTVVTAERRREPAGHSPGATRRDLLADGGDSGLGHAERR
jgi:hypothetical protein